MLRERAEVSEEEWEYRYKVIKEVKETPDTLGEEKIRYKGNLVFLHHHIITPIK